ncbi:MAG: DUF1572 domain-containing protein [Chitinophagaceae bacterium]|nr:MAG: DUF1572 domain-containing protein [Chitinophagaceae bacterium]
MMIEEITDLFVRDLRKLKYEIALYRNHDKLWYQEKAIANPAGNLCLHLIGNLKAYIGTGIGKISYTRDRELEFSATDVPVSVLLSEIDDTIIVVQKSLQTLKDIDLDKEFPVKIWDQSASISFTLFHLLAHLSYHLGQINYHRRLLDF